MCQQQHHKATQQQLVLWVRRAEWLDEIEAIREKFYPLKKEMKEFRNGLSSP